MTRPLVERTWTWPASGMLEHTLATPRSFSRDVEHQKRERWATEPACFNCAIGTTKHKSRESGRRGFYNAQHRDDTRGVGQRARYKDVLGERMQRRSMQAAEERRRRYGTHQLITISGATRSSRSAVTVCVVRCLRCFCVQSEDVMGSTTRKKRVWGSAHRLGIGLTHVNGFGHGDPCR